MPVTNSQAQVGQVFMAATGIKSQCLTLQQLTGTVSFNIIRDRIDQIYNAKASTIDPFVLLGQSTVNAKVASSPFSGYPADTYTALVNLQNAINTFFTSYKTLYDTAGNIMTFSVNGGHAFINVQVSALSSLATPLANIITAASLLELG